MFLECRLDRLRVLVRHQAHADLGRGRSGDDGLGALACEAADEAVGVEGGAASGALQGQEPVFAF